MSIGTVTYMPPEQVAADPNVDGRADVYSLAAVAYELLAGTPPFTGSPAQVMSAHVIQPAPPLRDRAPGVPAVLAAAIMAGLAKDPADRPDADRFAAEVDAAGRGGTGEVAVGGRFVPSRAATRFFALGAAALVMAALGWWLSGASRTASAAEPTIAVLPFETIGATDDAYLSAGVTDELMTGLAQVPGIRVLSRASIRAYADSAFTPAAYAVRFGVRALVEGTVQRVGGQLRVSARLIDVRDGSAIWSERYDRAVEDVFRTQQEISGAVAAALSTRLGIAAGGPRMDYVADPVAYDLFLRGRFAMRERGEAGLRRAMALFSKSAERDPAFARAHAGIAEAAALLPIYSAEPRRDVADTLRASAARAVARDSLLATPHVALGLLEKGLGNWDAGERELGIALRLDPNDPSAHQSLGELQFTLGRFAESRASLERAARLEPTDASIVAEFAYSLVQVGATDSAARTVARAATAAPRNPFVAYTQGVVAETQGDVVAASRYFRTAAEAAPLPFFRGALARALAVAGDAQGAAALRGELDALGDAPGATFARVIAGLPFESPDLLFVGLRRAVDERDPFVLMLPFRVAWYDRVRGDRRLAEIAAQLGLPPLSVAPR
jgi:serine/threonine-protein kinase